MNRGQCFFQPLERRVFLHAGHEHVGDVSGVSPAWIDPVEISRIGFDHAYEHYLSAVSIAALGGQQPVAPPSDSIAGGGPDMVGQWGTAANWPRVAVHAALLPTGKVIFWDYNDNPTLWDPATGLTTNAAKANYNIFCTGHNLLADGRLLVAGGHVVNGQGLPNASIYNPFNNTWAPLPNMNNGRWYPTNTTLPNGDTLVVSGSYTDTYTNNQLPQVWPQGGSSWRNLTTAQRTLPLYPHMFLAPNGKVALVGDAVTSRYIDTSGTGAWTTIGNHLLAGGRSYGSAVMYDDGKILVMGGGDPPTPTAEVIDLNAPTPAWRNVDAMDTQRRQINSTILADGQILVTGGVSGAGFNNTGTPVYTAELWDPETESFTAMSSMTRPRWYHSTAMLLPDGRVLSMGGDSNASAEIFSPAYLFNGERPTITTAPTSVGYGQSVNIQTPDAVDIDKVHLIRFSSVTHAINMDQRINRLTFTQTPGGLQITAPSDANKTPPGYYMLFILNDAGVPSVANMIQVAPAISANVTDSQAAEEGGNTATLTISRTGSTIGAMNVAYTIGGSATNGVDYQLLSGTATIPNGQTSTTITITPNVDGDMEGTETIVLTLSPTSIQVVPAGAGVANISLADTPPKVLASLQVWQTLPHELHFDFSRDVSASLALADIVVQNTTTSSPVTPDSFNFDTGTNRATLGFINPLPDGNYTATITAAGVTDALGTALAANHVFNFHFLVGDANHDAKVDSDDFNILATNFGLSNRIFSHGDFNYDTLVTSDDFNLLATKFGAIPGPSPIATALAAPRRTGTIDLLRDESSDVLGQTLV
jgi:hypothetical protein